MLVVTLPDGSKREFDAPVRVLDVAQSIGSGLAKAALGGIVDGKMVDASFVIDKDSQLAIVTDKSPEALEIVRHSTAHLLAYAVKELFPEAQVTISDLRGDGDHYAAHVVSPAFIGKNRVQQHQMVYTALKGKMGNELHALALTTEEK